MISLVYTDVSSYARWEYNLYFDPRLGKFIIFTYIDLLVSILIDIPHLFELILCHRRDRGRCFKQEIMSASVGDTGKQS